MKSQKFYQESWFVILMLVVFFPVGLFLMWKHKKFNFAARVVISIVIGLVLIGVNNSDKDSKVSETSSSHTTPQIEEEVQPTLNPILEEDIQEDIDDDLIIEEITTEEETVTENIEKNVYITETGSRYHVSGCRHLKNSKIEISLKDAKLKYQPCSQCNP